MLSTIQITFESVGHSDVIEGYIRGEVENLRDVEAPVTSSTIVVTSLARQAFLGRSIPAARPAYG